MVYFIHHEGHEEHEGFFSFISLRVLCVRGGKNEPKTRKPEENINAA